MKKQSYFIILILALAAMALSPLLAPQAVCADNPFHPAQVKDISDRAYEKALIELLDNAQESIVISMFIIKSSDDARHPINRLIKDLVEALDRGVSVKIYLNTKTDEEAHVIEDPGQGPAFELLRQKGALICPVHSRYMLHDKMIIVDERFVVIGSTNWSASALTRNLESTVLIDSPALAKERLARLATIHLEGEDLRDPPQISLKTIYSLPEELELPQALMDNKAYFPAMLTTRDNRAMDLYLLLVAESYRRNSQQFSVNLEKLAEQLSMPDEWDATTMRRQVIKSLRKLKTRYRLIDVEFKQARAAKIELFDIAGETFPLKNEFFEAEFLDKYSQSEKFVLLIEAYLKAQGKEMEDFTNNELGKMFYINKRTIRKGKNGL